jgi:lysyl-tRNA synthetase class 2
MTLGRVPAEADRECQIAIASDAGGVPVAYLTLLPGGEGFYSLDLTRRLSTAPNAIVEFLLLEVLERLRERDAATVSLNFSTFSSLPALPGGGALLRVLSRPFQLSSLAAFNGKFKPRWEPRYLAFPSWAALPDVIYAVLALEGVGRMVVNAGRRAMRRQTRTSAADSVARRTFVETA